MKDKGDKNIDISDEMKNVSESIKYLYEDQHLISVVKPFGTPTQSDRTGDVSLHDLVTIYLEGKEKTPGGFNLRLLHRLDRPVGGVILFAKTPAAAKRLSAAFRERRVRKIYLARIEGAVEPPAGELSHHLLKSGTKIKIVPEGTPKARDARLSYRTLKKDFDMGESLVEIDLITGRRHQIRAQLSAVGHSILGDLKYGSREKFVPGGIALFSKSLTFIHPASGDEITISADPPEEFFIDL